MTKNIAIMGPDGKPSPIKEDKGFNLAMSQEVSDALSEKCERVNQLEKYCEELKTQCQNEVNELKEVATKLGNEVKRLRKLLDDNGVDWHE